MPSLADIIADILKGCAHGERADPDAYLRQYPEHADVLGDLFGDLEVIDAFRHEPAHKSSGKLRRAPLEDPSSMDGIKNNPPAGFQIVRELHRGAEGVVYEAIQRSTCRTVALKMSRRRPVSQFEYEARLIAALRHPNVVTVYEAGVHAGHPYCAMELVEGESLDEHLLQHDLDVRAKLRLFVKICSGVSHAHRRGIIHRDLKPSNVVIDGECEPRVLDFGLAKRATVLHASNNGRSEVGYYVGTLTYSSPEQLAGQDENVDTRSDIYSLGIILHELLTKNRPYAVIDNPAAALDAVVRYAAARPSLRRQGIDRDLECIVFRATELDPDRRYQTVDALAAEIDRYLKGQPLSQKDDQPFYVVRKLIMRHRLAVAAVGVALTIITALVVKSAVLLAEQQASLATAQRRFEIARDRDLQVLSDYQRDVASALRLQQVARLPADQVAAHLARYADPPLEPDATLQAIAETIPAATLATLRKDPGAIGADEQASLEAVDEDLNALAATLEAEYFRFALKQERIVALGWEFSGVSDATAICGAFVNRAYRRHDSGDAGGAVADIRAATLLATDVGDGVLMAHKVYAYRCHAMILRFLDAAIAESFERDADASAYLHLVRTYPELPPASSALYPICLGIHELMNVALVTGPAGAEERIDLDRLDAFIGGYFASIGALTRDNVERARQLTAADLFALTDRYVLCAQRWDSLDAFQIEEEIVRLTQEIVEERERNPMLWLFSLPGVEFLDRLEVCSRRQALRIVAYADEYRWQVGDWPSALEEALPQAGRNEAIDPRTGRAFEYEVRDGMPRLRSLRSGHGDTANESDESQINDPSPWVTYFPMRATPADA
jgi:hypothetical protein